MSRSQWKKLLNLKITPYPASVTSFVIWLTHTSYAFFNYPISASHAFCCLHPENNTTNDYKKKCSKENIIEDYDLFVWFLLTIDGELFLLDYWRNSLINPIFVNFEVMKSKCLGQKNWISIKSYKGELTKFWGVWFLFWGYLLNLWSSQVLLKCSINFAS